MKDDALSPSGYLMGDLPIAPPDNKLRVEVESIASRSNLPKRIRVVTAIFMTGCN